MCFLLVVAVGDSLQQVAVEVVALVVFRNAPFISRLERTPSLLVLVVPQPPLKQAALRTSARQVTHL